VFTVHTLFTILLDYNYNVFPSEPMPIDVLPCSSGNIVDFSSEKRKCSMDSGVTVPLGKQRRGTVKSSSHNYETTFVRNTVALAVINRLHQWCCQLFWFTIVCVIGCCGEMSSTKQKTLQDVRRSIASNHQQRRCRTVTDLEMQLLRHLTCPQTAVLRPLRRNVPKKRHQLSRPPSPQLFDICEEADESVE
jgi:hypothetical protein